MRRMVTVKGGKGAEILNHVDLLDMPDVAGTNTDHDVRYVKKSGDTMTGDLSLTNSASEKPVLTLRNTTLGGDTPYLNIANDNGTLSLYVNADGTGVIDGSGGKPLYVGSPSEFSSGGGGTSDLGSLTDKWKDLFLSASIIQKENLSKATLI